ncbi:MAG: hypothetical protein HY421_01980 [Candidatus Kerfeldbacteria bacterium]|nr:hypothetical protein [Candidatus Kerfeldbacteria bacterium]
MAVSKIFVPLLAGWFVLVGVRVNAVWSDPVGLEPPNDFPGGFILPLNTSSTAQTKEGLLTLNGPLTALGSLCIGQVGNVCDNGGTSNGGTSPIVWNGFSRSSWTAAALQSFVRLQPPSVGTELGAGEINGTPVYLAPFTLRGRAGPQLGFNPPSYGIEGVAANLDGGFAGGVDSAGAVGMAMVGLANHYGLYASKGSGTASAAYFAGHVRLTGGTDASDLVIGQIGPNAAAVRINGISEVCLNDQCRADWQLGGSSQWVYYGPTNTLWPGSTTRDWSVANGRFTVTNRADLTVDVAVSGGSKFGGLVVGTPTGAVNTCGDGLCTASESVSTCALDCDTLPPGPVSNVTSVFASNMLTLNWTLPGDSDLAGTKVIQNALVPPTSPLENGSLILEPTATFTSTPLALGQTYYFGLYAYDQSGNYSSGVQFQFTAP